MQITKEMIFEAAAALVAEGKTPKVAAVRDLLGKGSFTTINEAMREWREGQKQPEGPAPEVAPQSIADRMQELGNEIWRSGLKLANESLAAERIALETAKIEMDEQQRETAEYADELSEKAEKWEAKARELTELLEVERISHQGTHRQLQIETDEVVKLTAKLEAEEKRIEDLRSEVKSTRELLDKSNREREDLILKDRKQAEDIVRLDAERSALREKLEDANLELQKKLGLQKAEKEFAQDENKRLNEAAAAAKIEAATMKGELEALRKQVSQQAELFKNLSKPEAPEKKTKGKAAPEKTE